MLHTSIAASIAIRGSSHARVAAGGSRASDLALARPFDQGRQTAGAHSACIQQPAHSIDDDVRHQAGHYTVRDGVRHRHHSDGQERRDGLRIRGTKHIRRACH